jgi:uncharacterized repeat protein (TIGR01451 family)
MRKILLSFFVFLTTLAVQGQVVNIPDANFKNALLTHNPVININGDGEIQVSEAVAFTGTINVQYKNVADLTGIDAFTNIQGLNCRGNNLTSLTLTNLTALISLNCNTNFSNASLTMNNVPALKSLDCGANKLTTLSFTNPAILDTLLCDNNKLTSLPTGLSAIRVLDCPNNQIPTFLLDNLNNLRYLSFDGNLCTAFSINNKPFLTDIHCSRNQITSLTLSNLPALKNLYCDRNMISTLSLSGFLSLQYLICQKNQLTSLTVSNLPSLKQLICQENQLTSLSFVNFPSLEMLLCDANPLTSFTVNNLPLVNELSCGGSNLTNLNLPNLPSLKYFACNYSKLTSLSLINFPALQRVTMNVNNITSLTLKNLPLLNELNCSGNSYTSLALDSLPSLAVLYCGENDSLTSLSLKLPGLVELRCDSTKLTTIDLSQTRVTQTFLRKNPLLQYINLKNGFTTYFGNYYYFFNQNPSLQFVCADTSELAFINTAVNNQLPGQNVTVSSLCNYTPGTYNTIKGSVLFDGTNNGCNNQDSGMYNLKMKIVSGPGTGYSYTNTQGKYAFFVVQNPNTVTPTFGNAYFNATPLSYTFNFTGFGNTAIADFCITANGVHPDLEITLIPVGRARPGFDANYKLVYRNKGNQLQSGTVTLTFDNSKINFISAVPPAASQGAGSLSWNYTGLSPYETRVINLIFHVNAPPVVNSGDILPFVAIVNPVAGDETPADNTFYLNQIVVNSFDPNDKQVTEGSQISIDKLGDCLHYVIRFQNTGTADAIRVIVKDSLSSNLDWNSFEPIIASHPYRAVMSKGYLAEFIFDGINLPPKVVNEPASNGFVSFKIKPKSNLAIGDSIQNTASIYFDFNLPIITNTVTTKIYKPVNNNVSPITVYSNPTKDYLSFSVKPGVEIKGINLFNSMGQKMNVKIKENTATSRKIDVSNFANGVYFLELISNLGKVSQKVMIVR